MRKTSWLLRGHVTLLSVYPIGNSDMSACAGSLVIIEHRRSEPMNVMKEVHPYQDGMPKRMLIDAK